MNPKIPKDTIFIILYVVISIIIITTPPLNTYPIRAIVGFPLVLFLPGYSLVVALFPRNNEIDTIERIALSIGLSICIVVFIGLGLNYTPWGIRLGPILLTLSAFILTMTCINTIIRLRLPDSERYMI